MNEFQDKVVLISGSSRGVGFALAKELVKRGAKVVINARGNKRLDQAKSALQKIGGEVVAVCGNIGVWEDSQKMVEKTIDHYGRLDILVNNAGISMRSYFDKLSVDVCKQMVDTNLVGSIFLSRAAVKHIIKAKGQIIFISSIAGLFGIPQASIYSTTKGALTNFCDSLRIEMSPLGVHTGVVYLGYIEHDPEKRILSSDGSLIPHNHPAHYSQEKAAKIILKVLQKRKKKAVITPIGKLSWIAHKISPGLVEKVILKAHTCKWKTYKRYLGLEEQDCD